MKNDQDFRSVIRPGTVSEAHCVRRAYINIRVFVYLKVDQLTGTDSHRQISEYRIWRDCAGNNGNRDDQDRSDSIPVKLLSESGKFFFPS